MTENNFINKEEREYIFNFDIQVGNRRNNISSSMLEHAVQSNNNRSFYLIDINSSINSIRKVNAAIKENGWKNPLFVLVKRTTRDYFLEVLQQHQMNFVTRWLSGTLTNSAISQKRYKEYINILESDNTKQKSKRSFVTANEFFKNFNYLTIPDVIIFSDLRYAYNVVCEAKKANIPTIGICDLDCSLDNVTYPIIANDDSAISLRYVFGNILKPLLANRE